MKKYVPTMVGSSLTAELFHKPISKYFSPFRSYFLSRSYFKDSPVRERAKDSGDPAKAVVEAALLKNPGADLKQRLESLVATLAWSHPPIPEDLRRLRAIAVLERAGTKEARAKIDELASGLPTARVTHEAKAAKGRLAVGDLLKAKK